MQILTIINQNFEKPSRNPSNRTSEHFEGKKKFYTLPKKYGSAFAHSQRKCSKSKFWQKLKEKN
jgi:hypothetical protein